MDQLVMRWLDDGKEPVHPVMPPDTCFVTLPEREDGIEEWLDIVQYGLSEKKEDVSYYNKAMRDVRWYEADKCFILLYKGAPAATVTVICNREEKNGCIHMVAVKPEFRGRGFGTLLCDKAMFTLKSEGMVKAYLTTDDYRIPAIKSYLRAGFFPDKRNEEYERRWKDVFDVIEGRK